MFSSFNGEFTAAFVSMQVWKERDITSHIRLFLFIIKLLMPPLAHMKVQQYLRTVVEVYLKYCNTLYSYSRTSRKYSTSHCTTGIITTVVLFVLPVVVESRQKTVVLVL